MKFYSQIKNRPNSVMKEIKDGNKVVERRCLCTFQNGVVETNDPKVIEELQKRPDLFRTDGPWKLKILWQETPEGEKLLEKGKKLGIDTRHIRKERLEALIAEKGEELPDIEQPEPDIEEKSPVAEKVLSQTKPEIKEEKTELKWREIQKKAKEAGINTFGRKKADLLEILKQKGVI